MNDGVEVQQAASHFRLPLNVHFSDQEGYVSLTFTRNGNGDIQAEGQSNGMSLLQAHHGLDLAHSAIHERVAQETSEKAEREATALLRAVGLL